MTRPVKPRRPVSRVAPNQADKDGCPDCGALSRCARHAGGAPEPKSGGRKGKRRRPYRTADGGVYDPALGRYLTADERLDRTIADLERQLDALKRKRARRRDDRQERARIIAANLDAAALDDRLRRDAD